MHLNLVKSTPTVAQKDTPLTIHGDTRIDPYYWLRERENPEVIDYLEAENAYTEKVLAPTKELQETIFQEITNRIKQDDASVPYRDNGYFYYRRYQQGLEHPIYARKKERLEAEEEVFLNVNELAADHDYYQVSDWDISPDNQLLVFGEDTLSRRLYTLRFKNLSTGAWYPDRIPNTTGSAVWANDNRTVFYAQKDVKTLRSWKIFRHVLGTDPSEDVEVFFEEEDTYYTFVYKTKSDKYIVIGSETTLASERLILEADNPSGDFRVFQPRQYEQKLEYGISHFQDRWYIRTNYQAENFRLMSCPENQTGLADWKEVIPHREDVLLEGIDVFTDYLVLTERIKGITQVRVKPWDGGAEHYIEFPEEAHLAYPASNKEFDTDQLRLGYQSMKTPPSIYDYDMKERKLNLKKEQEVVGAFDKRDYASERLFAKAQDGTMVPISLVYRKDRYQKNGQSPLLLYGYGSYGNSMEPYFSIPRLSLLDRGFCFAIAHIRGGEEMGRQWYEKGKLLYKKNTFTDFIDCAEFLQQGGYASPDGLYAMGGSAGGLLVGAVMNMRPDLWKGVIAAVPFVDVVTTMLDKSIPLTTFEYDEWGNPNDPEYYAYIKSYSPYDNVDTLNYPHLLVTTGLHDSQVQYWEPAKWVAKLRDQKNGEGIILLHTDMSTGHGGKSGRFERHRETAMMYAFLLALQGAQSGE